VELRAIDVAGNIDASPAARTFRVQVPLVVVPEQPQASTRLVLDASRKVRAGKKANLRVQLVGVGTGRVVIRDGRKVVRTVKVKGRATVKLRLKPGKHRLSASYAGSATAKPATSAWPRFEQITFPRVRPGFADGLTCRPGTSPAGSSSVGVDGRYRLTCTNVVSIDGSRRQKLRIAGTKWAQ
jgi:hypothetical protein